MTLIKTIHLITAFLSISGFILRGVWLWTNSPMLGHRWVKVAPHINDTLLLGSALTMAVFWRFSPLDHAWLSTKILAVLIYIGLGSIAFKHTQKNIQMAAWLAAILMFSFILSVAISKSPWGFLNQFNT